MKETLAALHEAIDQAIKKGAGLEILENFTAESSADWLVQLQVLMFSNVDHELTSAARQKFEEIAQLRGLRSWELADRIVPNCGLGQWYGTEDPFEIRLNAALDPVFVNKSGQVRELTPAEAELCQKDLVTLVDALPTQILRLEAALVEEQRWRKANWESFFLGHPLLARLSQRLVWGAYAESGRLRHIFRVDEEFELLDVEDEPFELEEPLQVGLLHPLHAQEQELSAWSEVLSDYEIVTLVPQLDRPKFSYPPPLSKSTELKVEFSEPVEHTRLHAWFMARGWSKSQSYYGDVLVRMFRTADTKVTLRLKQNGENVVNIGAKFERFLGYPRSPFMLRDVRPVVISEVISELQSATSA